MDDRCWRCEAPSRYHCPDGSHWCEVHFQCAQLCEMGELLRWQGFAFSAGEGLVRPSDPEHGWEPCAGGIVPSGRTGYYQFCADEPSLAAIWQAAYEAKLIQLGFRTAYLAPEVEYIPCARHPGGCTRHANTPHRLWWEKDHNHQYIHPVTVPYTDLYGHIWCAHCTQGGRLLELADTMNFPSFRSGDMKIEQGYTPWEDFVTHSSLFDIVYCYDLLIKNQYSAS